MISKSKVKNEILRCGFVPVIRVADSQVAVRVAEAIRDGGAPLLEITMTVPGALDVIKQIARSLGTRFWLVPGPFLTAKPPAMLFWPVPNL